MKIPKQFLGGDREVPIAAAVAINEIEQELRSATGLNVVSIQSVEPPLKSEIPWINADGQTNDDLMITKAFIIAGVEILTICAKVTSDPDSDWDCQVMTREHGFQIWPPDPSMSIKLPAHSDIVTLADRVAYQFIGRYPGDEKFLDWIERNKEINGREKSS